MVFFDSHCHLNDPRYDFDAELELCAQKGVAGGVIVGTNLQDSARALSLARRAGEQGFAFGASCGVHPEEVEGAQGDWLDQLQQLASDPYCVAIGEVGLDYHWQPYDPELQKAVLTPQLEMARQLGKPVIFHLRDCHADFWSFMEGQDPLPGAVMHCFDGSLGDALRGLEQGWYVGFTGAVTFKRSDELRAIVAALPKERLLSETDCPYMAPVPHRGKENRPAFLPFVVEEMAKAQGLAPEAMAAQLAANGKALFGLDVTACLSFESSRQTQ